MKRVFIIFLWLFIVVAIIGAGTAAYFGYIWSSNLPYIGSVREYRPPIITEVYSSEGEVIGRFWVEKRIVVPLQTLPKHLIQAFVAAEDARFFEHEGVDLVSIARAFFKNLVAGRIEQGGSTITQQVTKSLLLKNTRRTYRRKVREAILSVQLEKSFSKEEILFLYLNQIYLGHGAYGVEAAAQTYFNKSSGELNIAEAALLAGLPQAPARYSPVAHYDRARARQEYVLERMWQEGFITEEDYRASLAVPLKIEPSTESTFDKAPYFTEHVRRYLMKTYGRELLYKGGLKVYTTVDLDMQQTAEKALRQGLSELDKREGFRGPIKHLEAEEAARYMQETAEKGSASSPPKPGDMVQALVETVSDKKKRVVVRFGEHTGYLPLSGMQWARKPDPETAYYAAKLKKPSQALKPGDLVWVKLEKAPNQPKTWEVSLDQTPDIQGALYCMAPQSGEVKAMLGGRDFAVSQFDRAVQAKRQPGSAFKPIIYAAALDWGLSPAEILLDAPYVALKKTGDNVWKPKNYKRKFHGPTLFRTALAKSRNVITVKILKRIGVNYSIEYAGKLGITSPLSPDLSLALGSSGLSLMEITTAYSAFANGGMLPKPIFIRRIVDRSGQVVEENHPQLTEAISKQTAYVMTDLLRAVINEGTGWRARALNRPAAGKTGTTNELWDAWFIGYTPTLLTGVWVGYDDRRSMGRGETGSRAAGPIWLKFMSAVLEGKRVVDFEIPEGVVFAKIDTHTGLLAGPHSKKTVIQAFAEGKEPQEYSPKPRAAKTGQFLQFDMEPGR
ncbi:MAG: PBP1A family penicillin-binding protein [Deltaproteobacteria bacterium]|nr:PBP1A family penicillin-binding protein [Deltaproteobacteria bacterium]MBW1817750.1 PBP1A family penicillin-binding protein [Deltaproteobacteria bacterium]